MDRPGDSAPHLFGGDLSVLRLAGRDLSGAEFAYLSACRTAAGGVALADEAINLAADLRSAGYRHVIGTLWSVTDTHAPGSPTACTARSPPAAGPATTATATALADAMAALVHLGP